MRMKRGVAINPAGKAYRKLIWATLHECLGGVGKWDAEPMHGDLMVEIIIYPPDKRKRDIDNIKKALFDALQHAGLYEDDSQIVDDHTIKINKVVKGGLIDFRIQRANSNCTICFQVDAIRDSRIEDFLKGFSL
jgi:crossover junction endodeoxyribonuclease RusA